MFFPWGDYQKDAPVAFQLLEKFSGFTYNSVYGVLQKEDENGRKTQLEYPNVEYFFDSHGWFLTIMHMGREGTAPIFNGVISNMNGELIFNDPSMFKGCHSRPHAKSLLTGIAMSIFDRYFKEATDIKPEKTLLLTEKSLIDSAQNKSLYDLQMSDVSFHKQGLFSEYDTVIVVSGTFGAVMKSKQSMLPVGLVVPAEMIPSKLLLTLEANEEF